MSSLVSLCRILLDVPLRMSRHEAEKAWMSLLPDEKEKEGQRVFKRRKVGIYKAFYIEFKEEGLIEYTNI